MYELPFVEGADQTCFRAAFYSSRRATFMGHFLWGLGTLNLVTTLQMSEENRALLRDWASQIKKSGGENKSDWSLSDNNTLVILFFPLLSTTAPCYFSLTIQVTFLCTAGTWPTSL